MTAPLLILGATGKTGRRLVPLLAAKGHTVRAASRRAPVPFRWEAPETHDATLAGVHAVYLVPPDESDPTPLTGPFLARALQAGVQRVVLLSSLGVTFPAEPADSGRRRLEAQVRDSGLAWTILRPSGFDQNFSEGFLLPGILRGGVVVSSTGSGAAAMVDAADIAAVAAEALVRDELIGHTLPVTGPRALSFPEATAIISHAAGRDIAFRGIDAAAFRGLLLGVGASPAYVEAPVRDQRAIREGYGALVADTVLTVTGRPPRTFEAFAQEAAAVWAV